MVTARAMRGLHGTLAVDSGITLHAVAAALGQVPIGQDEVRDQGAFFLAHQVNLRVHLAMIPPSKEMRVLLEELLEIALACPGALRRSSSFSISSCKKPPNWSAKCVRRARVGTRRPELPCWPASRGQLFKRRADSGRRRACEHDGRSA